VLVVHETTLELETRDLDHPVICWCIKHRQLACQEGVFVACFPLNVLKVCSLKLTFVANGNNLTDVGLAPGETIWFGNLEFTAHRLSNLSLSPEGNDSGTVFVGIMNNGSPSVHTIHEESFDEGGMASGRGGSSGLLSPRGCNVVTLIAPITTTPPPENAPALWTIPIVPLWTAAPQPGTRLLPEQHQAYQKELVGEQAIVEALLTELHHRMSMLETEQPIMIELAKACARTRAVATAINREGVPHPTFAWGLARAWPLQPHS
jgi:hypothetical protein